jgi:hypothetical protein
MQGMRHSTRLLIQAKEIDAFIMVYGVLPRAEHHDLLGLAFKSRNLEGIILIQIWETPVPAINDAVVAGGIYAIRKAILCISTGKLGLRENYLVQVAIWFVEVEDDASHFVILARLAT